MESSVNNLRQKQHQECENRVRSVIQHQEFHSGSLSTSRSLYHDWIRVPLQYTLTMIHLWVTTDKNTLPCILPQCFTPNLPSYSFGTTSSLHWPYKTLFLGNLFPSFPAGRNRYVLLIFTSWGKKKPTPRDYPYWCQPAIATKSALKWDFTGGTSQSSQHHKEPTSGRNLLVMRVTLNRVCSQQLNQRGMCLHQEEQMNSQEGTQGLVINLPGSQTFMETGILEIQTCFKPNGEQICF